MHGVRVIMVSGGLLRTTDVSRATPNFVFDLIAGQTPLRQLTTPEDFADAKSDNTYFPSQNAILNWLPKLARMWFTVCSSSTLVRRVSAIQRCFISHHSFSMRLSSGL